MTELFTNEARAPSSNKKILSVSKLAERYAFLNRACLFSLIKICAFQKCYKMQLKLQFMIILDIQTYMPPIYANTNTYNI